MEVHMEVRIREEDTDRHHRHEEDSGDTDHHRLRHEDSGDTDHRHLHHIEVMDHHHRHEDIDEVVVLDVLCLLSQRLVLLWQVL